MKRFIEFALNNRLLMVTLAVFVLLAGVISYKRLPIDAFPDVSPVLVQVFTETEGLAPQEVEKYVTYPVEVAMNGLPNLEKIRSVSNFGLSVVNIYFKDGTDIYFARQLVNERLQEVREEIPEGFGNPQMGPISTGMGLILFYHLEDTTGKYSLEDLRTIQDWVIKFNLETVPGVTEVLSIGGYEKQFHVVVHPDKLLRYGVTIEEIIEKIKANNLNVGAQFIVKNNEEYIVRSVGLVSDIEDIENIVIKSEDGTPVYLKDIAHVKIGGAIRRGVQTMNGDTEVVAGMVIKLYGENSSTVIQRVEEKIEKINKMLPEGIKIVPYYEQKSLVDACIETVTSALMEGIVLVVIILMVFLGAIRPSVVVALSIPFSVLFAMVGMYYLGISANLMSFGGLAIAIGMMVDGGVVIVENIDRWLRSERDKSFMEIIRAASIEVIRPITFAVMIIIIVFLPLFTLSGVEGKTFSPLAYAVALAMGGSIVFTIFVAPVLASIFMPLPGKGKHKENIAFRILLRYYEPIVRFFVNRRMVAVGLAVVFLVTGIAIFPQLGSEFTPRLQEGTIVVRLTMAPSISLDESQRVTMLVEKRLLKIPEVVKVVSRIGRGEVGAHTDPVNSAEMYVILKPREEWRVESQEEIEELIRDELGNVPGVLVNITQPIAMTLDELISGIKAELAVKLFGDDLDVLKQKAEEIATVLRSVPGSADVQVAQVTGTPQLIITIDRHKIARYGINVEDIQEVIRSSVGGEVAGELFEGIKRFAIFVRFPKEFRDTPDAIKNILIKAPDGQLVPLGQLAKVEEVVGPRQITRENNQRFITIQCNVTGVDIGTFVKKAQERLEKEVSLPPGYMVTWGGQFELQQEANKRLMVVIPITLFIIFILLFSAFHSLRSTLLIFLNIPLALVGGIVALFITGQNLSVPSTVGFIALFGIALLNGIVLVTYLNQLVKAGMPVDEASVKGACLRVRPVMMTALVQAFGMVPLLLSQGVGSEIQRPLATVVVGGLFTSTVLTLLVIPAIYRWFVVEEKKEEEVTE